MLEEWEHKTAFLVLLGMQFRVPHMLDKFYHRVLSLAQKMVFLMAETFLFALGY